jgi:hypothetical protein
MASQRQLEANRANAKRSTGPTTPQGKARSRRNSYKNGLRAGFLLSSGEDEAEFDRLRGQLLDEHNPQSTLQAKLVEKLARTLLLMERADCFEAASLDARCEELSEAVRRATADPLIDLSIMRASSEEEEEQAAKTPEAERRLQLGKALLYDAANGDVLAKVDRHRTTLMNDCIKIVKLLHFLQERRVRDQDQTLMIEEAPSD